MRCKQSFPSSFGALLEPQNGLQMASKWGPETVLYRNSWLMKNLQKPWGKTMIFAMGPVPQNVRNEKKIIIG